MYVPENDQSAGTAPTAAPLPDVKPREGEPYEAFIARRAEAGAASSAPAPASAPLPAPAGSIATAAHVVAARADGGRAAAIGERSSVPSARILIEQPGGVLASFKPHEAAARAVQALVAHKAYADHNGVATDAAAAIGTTRNMVQRWRGFMSAADAVGLLAQVGLVVQPIVELRRIEVSP